MKKTLPYLIFFAFLAFFPSMAYSGGVTVMELFTSQGCPSCPPADRLLQNLTDEDGFLITLGCHVTYFDRENWRDSMSQVFCDAKQIAYKKSGIAAKVYTPQAIINGRSEAVGSRENEVRSALADAKKITELRLTIREGYLDIELPPMKLEKPADIWLLGLSFIEVASIAAAVELIVGELAFLAVREVVCRDVLERGHAGDQRAHLVGRGFNNQHGLAAHAPDIGRARPSSCCLGAIERKPNDVRPPADDFTQAALASLRVAAHDLHREMA